MSSDPSTLDNARQRLQEASTEADVASVGLTAAAQLMRAEGGMVVRCTPSGLEGVAAAPTEGFHPLGVERGSVRSVIDTAQPLATIATDEPMIVEMPAALAVAPIVADRVVIGAILVVRTPTLPFDDADLDDLLALGAALGPAFHRADECANRTASGPVNDVEPLTGLHNRRRLNRDLAAVSAHDQVAYVMVDIDDLQNVNKSNGEAAGDEVIRQVGLILESAVRPGDHVYRHGGDVFCMLLPGATADQATLVAERARAAIEAAPIPGREHQPTGSITISVGVSDSAFGAPKSLLEAADAALDEAKRGGRNQVMSRSTTVR